MLSAGEKAPVTVVFDPAYQLSQERLCWEVKKHLTVSYKDHPHEVSHAYTSVLKRACTVGI